MAVLFVSCGFVFGQDPGVLLEDDFNDGAPLLQDGFPNRILQGRAERSVEEAEQ